MRLYKKAAVCLLAAAMAVSMMTACGGGAGGSGSGAVSGVTYTNNVAPANGIDADSMSAQTPLAAKDSKYVAFMQKLSTEKSQYIKETEVEYVNGVEKDSTTWITAQTENYYYTESELGKLFLEKKGDSIYYYRFFEDGDKKAAIKQEQKKNNPGTSDSGTTTPSNPTTVTLTAATVKVNNISYYAEIIHSGTEEMIACFKPDQPVPTYLFETENEESTTTVFNEVVFGSDKGTCAQMLNGCAVYTLKSVNSTYTEMTLEDEEGVEYKATYANGKWTVMQGTNDVTADFQWIIDKAY